jgi:DNA-binding CsgD family transcriptional regulator
MHGFRAGMTPKERRQTRRNSPPETSRDKVARLAADGLTDQQIGDLIGLTRHTVKWHRQALGVRKDNHGRIVA